jgi:murein DD-endopeptidase MepM/ murein hydrolase activator NlpD
MSAPGATVPTPYDNKIALWHHWGRRVSNLSIDDFAQDLQRQAPAVTAVYIKTHHGAKWQSEWGDSSPWLAISGTASIDRWVQTLAKYNIDFHAWCVPEGVDIPGEAARMIEVCNRPGVIATGWNLYDFYQGPRNQCDPDGAQSGCSAAFHIGMSVDPRPQHYNEIFPLEWFPFVGSIHPQCYWETFIETPSQTIDSAFKTWANYKRPIFPVLQAKSTPERIAQARTLSLNTYKARGVSWWLHRELTTSTWTAINVTTDGKVPAPIKPPALPPSRDVVVKPGDGNYRDGTFTGAPISSVVQTFTNSQGWTTKFKVTSSSGSIVWANWDPQLGESGWYEISAFVPGTHATTARARYKLHNLQGQQGETEVAIAQARYNDVWVPLGTFFLNADDPRAGVVFLNDFTGEPAAEIAFDAIRWRQIAGPGQMFVVDGFDAPIGTAAERRSAEVWPADWFDATGYAVRYRVGTPTEAFHTGADLNLNTPTWDADAHSPVYASAAGVVIAAREYPNWGNIVVIRHDPLRSGQVVYSRYAHVEAMRVRVGQRVLRGEQLASVGDAGGIQPYHLHFDVSHTQILESHPEHWPKLDLADLRANYLDPREFVEKNRPPRS